MTNVPAPFTAVDVNWNRNAENTLLLQTAFGRATIKLGPNYPGASAPTGLVPATTYTATVRIDGTNRAVSILGATALTVTTLVAELLADLTTWATVVLSGDTIVITSLTSGPTSGVFASDTGADFLFSSIRGGLTAALSPAHFGVVDYDSTRGWTGPDTLSLIAASTNRVGTSVKGNNEYFRSDKISDAQLGDLASVVDRFLAGGAANTNQPWVNAASSIAVPTGVPSSMTETGLSRLLVYQLQVNVNGAGNVTVSINLNVPQTSGASFDQLVEALNIGLAAARLPVVAEWQNGYNATQAPRVMFRVLASNTPFTPTSTGAVLQGTTSSLVLTAGLANDIVAALAAFGGAIDVVQSGFGVVNFNRVNAAAVLPATVPAVPTASYDATVNVNDAGVRTTYTVTVPVTVADSMTVIAASLQVAVRAATGETELVEAVGNKFLLTENQTGFNTYITVAIPTAGANPDLFRAIASALDVVDRRGTTSVSTYSVDGFATPGLAGATNVAFPKTVSGVIYTNWLQVLANSPVGGRLVAQNIFGPTGYGPLFTSDDGASFEKENRPASRGMCVRGQVYWDGATWRYFTDDTDAGANNPPEALQQGS